MVPWIQVYANMPEHKKISRLRDGLGLKTNYEAVGILVSLWAWAAIHASDGDLTGYSARDIARAVDYTKVPGKLLEALVASGLLDRGEDGSLRIHDWAEHAVLLMDAEEQQREKTKERVRRHRERKKAEKQEPDETPKPDDGNGVCNGDCNVTVTPCNAPTKPNLTKPNQTYNNLSGGDTREADEAELRSIGLAKGGPLRISQELVTEVRRITDELYAAYRPGDDVHEFDRYKVYSAVMEYDFGRAAVWLDEQKVKLLDYAFRQAREAGKVKDWRYIEGVLGNLAARGITTLEQAEAQDED